MKTKPWRYSHTQLALWKLCKRRYYNKYVLGKPEPKTPNMAAGTWLCQNPIETLVKDSYWNGNGSVYWESIWANFLAEFGGDDSFADKLFTLKLAKQILAAYKANPVAGKVVEIEHTYEYDFGEGLLYTSRPDFVVERSVPRDQPNYYGGMSYRLNRITWDIKLKTFNQRDKGDTFYAEAPLSPFDDQCLGQAILSGADAFGQIQFFLGKKDGVLIGPVYVEQPVSLILAEEWKRETKSEILDIDAWRTTTTEPWPKNDQACHAFGKACPRLVDCNFGFVRASLDKGNESC